MGNNVVYPFHYTDRKNFFTTLKTFLARDIFNDDISCWGRRKICGGGFNHFIVSATCTFHLFTSFLDLKSELHRSELGRYAVMILLPVPSLLMHT